MKPLSFRAVFAFLGLSLTGLAGAVFAQENKPAVANPQPAAPAAQPRQQPQQGAQPAQALPQVQQPAPAPTPAPATAPAAPVSPTTLPVFGDLNVLFTNLDGDNDGKLTRQEFLKMLALYEGYRPGGIGSQTSTGNPGSAPTKDERAGSNAEEKGKK